MHPFEIPEREEGQGLVEYALILVFVALAAVVAIGLLGTGLAESFQYVLDQITSSIGSS